MEKIEPNTDKNTYSGNTKSKHELSWTVAPDARGRGVGKRMVALAASQILAPIRAEVKSDNISSVRIAEHAGMVFEREVNGILHFSRPAQKQ